MQRTAQNGIADRIGEFMTGQQQAERFMWDARNGFPDPDALYYELLKAQASPARARGFARAVQKRIERMPVGA